MRAAALREKKCGRRIETAWNALILPRGVADALIDRRLAPLSKRGSARRRRTDGPSLAAAPKEIDMTRTPLLRIVFSVSVAGILSAIFALGVPRPASARDDEQNRPCTNASLQGDYGVLVSGVRGTPAGVESFVGTAFHSYDGQGKFVGFDNTQGELTSSVNRHVEGSYEIHPDCTGTTSMAIGPIVITTNFIVVDRGREVEETVTAPPGNRVTAVQRRIH
jgi:hypothetical protein